MMLSTQGFKANLSARFFFNRGTIQLFLQEFFVRWGGGGGGGGGGGEGGREEGERGTVTLLRLFPEWS